MYSCTCYNHLIHSTVCKHTSCGAYCQRGRCIQWTTKCIESITYRNLQCMFEPLNDKRDTRSTTVTVICSNKHVQFLWAAISLDRGIASKFSEGFRKTPLEKSSNHRIACTFANFVKAKLPRTKQAKVRESAQLDV